MGGRAVALGQDMVKGITVERVEAPLSCNNFWCLNVHEA